MSLTQFAPSTQILWKYMEDQGLDPASVFKKAGINPEVLANPEVRVNVSQVDRLWLLVMDKIDDPCFGLKMVNYWHPSQVGALGYAWLASSTLRTALKRAARYIHVVSEDLSLELEDSPRGLRVTVAIDETMLSLPVQFDLVLSILLHMCRYNFGEELVPTQVTLMHSQPDCTELFEDYFRSEVSFDADVNSITFARADVDTPLSSANRQLVLMHDDILMKYLIEIKKGDLREQIKSIIIDRLPDGKVTDKVVAKEINMSERSMQRKLKEMNTSFRVILNDVRKMVATQYIKNSANSMTDIAFLIGFSEQSAFSRAFKKWTGQSPRKYREAFLVDNQKNIF